MNSGQVLTDAIIVRREKYCRKQSFTINYRLHTEKYNIDMNGADFIGYILAGSQSGSPKDYAKSNSASYATLFEGINKFPNETSEYSSNVQEYNEELIVNFISEFLRIYIN